MRISRHTQFGANLVRNAPDEGGTGEATGPDFSFIPSDYQGDNGPDFEAFGSHYTETAASVGRLTEELESLRAGIPEAPDGYEFTMPEDLDFGDMDLPENFSVDLDPENPIFEELRAAMHEHGVRGEFASKMMGAFAKYQAGLVSQQRAAAREEVKKLGPQAEARLAAVKKSLENKIPDADHREALLAATSSAAGLRALETLIGGQTTTPTSLPKGRTNLNEITNPLERLNAVFSQRKAG